MSIHWLSIEELNDSACIDNVVWSVYVYVTGIFIATMQQEIQQLKRRNEILEEQGNYTND